jgi:hypothetical protein
MVFSLFRHVFNIPGEDFRHAISGSSLNRINATIPDAPVYCINEEAKYLLMKHEI